VAAGDNPVAIVYLSGDRSSQADRCEQLVELFGLLPSEARLAWEMAQAIPITQAAANLGLTVETARNYSKKIYAKMGARGQAELVRIIMSSVLAIT
jgi:DNA-binding CsgD family transcriptional regulator